MKAYALLSIVLIFCSAIFGCGQKGSLVLPEKKAAVAAMDESSTANKQETL
jgi:predicted small lipoprotein YifL